MEPAATADDGLSQENLEKELAGRSEEELREMGKRLTTSRTNLDMLSDELVGDHVSLQEENKQLRETIDLMMKELRKLNIGGANTVEPVLVGEGPLDFVGRYWEKVRPRDTAVEVSECGHVGEIKKPVVDETGMPLKSGKLPQEIAQQAQEHVQKAQEHGKQAFVKLSSAVGPALGSAWTTGEGFWKAAQEKLADATPKARPTKKEKRRKKTGKKGDEDATASSVDELQESLPDGWAVEIDEASGKPYFWLEDDPDNSVTWVHPSAAEAVAESPTFLPASRTTQASAAEGIKGGVGMAQDSAASEPVEPEAQAPVPPVPADLKQGGAEEQISSTILIEAQLKLDDGSVQTLQVRAADRCKEVAARFVREHSLKQWFEQPLTKFLKQAEDDADKFPVKIEGDLLEIRQKYGKP